MSLSKIILINVATIFVATLIPLIVSIVRTLTQINVKKCESEKEAKNKLLHLMAQDMWIEYWLRFTDIKVKLNKYIFTKPLSWILKIQEGIAREIAIPIIRSIRRKQNGN